MSISYQRLHSQSHFPFRGRQSYQTENGRRINTIHTCEESSSSSPLPQFGLRSLALLYLDLRSSVAVDCLRLVGHGARDSSDFAAIFVCSGEEIRWLVESLMLR
ncbi:hypothetical protein YC2023_042440 [Brassica napus]